MRTKATSRFRPKSTIRFRHIRPYMQRGSLEHDWRYTRCSSSTPHSVTGWDTSGHFCAQCCSYSFVSLVASMSHCMSHCTYSTSKKNGTGITRTRRKENGMMSLNACCAALLKADILYSAEQVLWNDELCEAKEVKNCLFTSVAIHSLLKLFLVPLLPSISWIFTEQ